MIWNNRKHVSTLPVCEKIREITNRADKTSSRRFIRASRLNCHPDSNSRDVCMCMRVLTVWNKILGRSISNVELEPWKIHRGTVPRRSDFSCRDTCYVLPIHKLSYNKIWKKERKESPTAMVRSSLGVVRLFVNSLTSYITVLINK